MRSLAASVTGILSVLISAVLNMGSGTPWGPVDRFQRGLERGWRNITTLFSLTSILNAAFQSILNVVIKVIYGL